MTTPLGEAIQFFKDFGLFDVVLPFLLVFSLIFALLEKTKVLGTEMDGKTPRRSLNTMISFVIGLLVVATNKVVTIINTALPNVVLLVVVVVMFLMLVGTFYKEGTFDFAESHKKWVMGFMIVLLLLIILIFLNSITLESGETVIEYLVNSALGGSEGGGVGSVLGASILFLLIAIVAVLIVTKKSSGKSGDK